MRWRTGFAHEKGDQPNGGVLDLEYFGCHKATVGCATVFYEMYEMYVGCF